MKRQATQVRIPQPCHPTTRQRRRQIVRLCAVIAREFQPEKIILFGSWAYGTPDTDSDIDLLVVMPFEGSPFRQAGTILNRVIQAVGVLPLDLLVRTAEQLDERLTIGDGFVRDILERGKVLYEADHA
jgi:predicted nucleotidyltransferase